MSEPAIKAAEGVVGYGLWLSGIDAQPHVAGTILNTLREYGYIVTTEADLAEALQRRLAEALRGAWK